VKTKYVLKNIFLIKKHFYVCAGYPGDVNNQISEYSRSQYLEDFVMCVLSITFSLPVALL